MKDKHVQEDIDLRLRELEDAQRTLSHIRDVLRRVGMIPIADEIDDALIVIKYANSEISAIIDCKH